MPFHWQLRHAAAAGVTFQVGDFQNAFAYTIGGLDNRFGLSLARTGRMAGTIGGVPFEVVPGRCGAMISPGIPGSSNMSSNYGTLNITIDAQALEAHLQTLTGRPMRGPLRFDLPIDFESPAGSTIQHLAFALTNEIGRQAASPLLINAVRDAFLTSLLTCLPHNHQEHLNPPPKDLSPRYLRKAEEFVKEHLDEPITLTLIAKEIGVSARSLQAAFQLHRGYSPMQFLKERRLELAHQRLLKATPGTTIAAIATTAGMDHLGRFSVDYKKRFGESPSQTLRRGCRRI
jgi:AraC-like DNA-binding protein